MSGGLQLPQGRRDHRLRRGASRGRVDGPNTERPPVSDSCSQVEKLAGDKPSYIEKRQGEKGGVFLGVSLVCCSLVLKTRTDWVVRVISSFW